MPIDTIYKGKAHGSVAQRLMAGGFNVNALRTNDVLLHEEWQLIDSAVLMAAQERLTGIADLQRRGLVYTIPNGLATTVFAYHDASDVNPAEISMDGMRRADRDRPDYTLNYLPLPIIHKDFSFSLRNLEESRKGSMPLDTTMAEMAGRKVAEEMEKLLFTGQDSDSLAFAFGGGTIYGYMTEENRNTGPLTANWDDSAATGEVVLEDVLGMKQALIDAKHYGPYIIYIPTNFETAIDADFKSNSDKTIRQRLLEISSIADIRVSDFLTADNVIMVQMTSDVVRLVEGMQLRTVQWDVEGGLEVRFKVMAITVPQLRATQEGDSGIAHWS